MIAEIARLKRRMVKSLETQVLFMDEKHATKTADAAIGVFRTALEQSQAALAEAKEELRTAKWAKSKLIELRNDNDALRARLETAKEALKPFARADTAIGEEPGPFRFETGTGYRELYREDFRRARAAIAEMEK